MGRDTLGGLELAEKPGTWSGHLPGLSFAFWDLLPPRMGVGKQKHPGLACPSWEVAPWSCPSKVWTLPLAWWPGGA